MNLLNKSKISVFPDDISVSDLMTGDLIEASNFYDKLFLQSMVVYNVEDSSVSEYYSINGGKILLPTDSILLQLVVDFEDIFIKEISIDKLEPNMYLCDSSVISQFDDKKSELLEVGVTSDALTIHRTINGLGEDFVLPIPVPVNEIELITKTEESKYIEVGYQDPSLDKNGFIFVDDIAVKVK